MEYPRSGQASPLRRGAFTPFAALLIACMLFTLAGPAAAFASSPGATTPPVPDWSRLPGFYKTASKQILTLGQTLNYTIHLEIGWTATYPADVTDPLPSGLDYVPGSATNGGVYDSATRTLSWSKVPVSGGAPVDLKFDVTDTDPVTLPTPTVNVATIALNGFVIQRQAWVTLFPLLPVAFPLAGSFKSASPRMLGPGDTVTYSIQLVNSGKTAATVDVSDPVPPILTYVAGSASNSGVYDPATKTITWTGILVPAMASVQLTFAATAPSVPPLAPSPLVITNTATITSGNLSFKRSTDILLGTHSISPLEGSFKAASQKEVAPGQEFSYMIELNNSSTAPVTAAVSDPLPAQVTYVDGSANAGGLYDPTTRTVTWTDLAVLPGSTLELTFKVTASSPILVIPVHILNTAYITANGITLKRSVLVLQVPNPGGDHIPPVVTSFTIGDRDVLTSPDVTLHIAAIDNVKVSQMYLVEWALTTAPFPHWQVVKTSGWIPYQADFGWTLSDQSGTHFMGVWVADSSMNRSHLTRSSVDFASLLLPGTKINPGGMIPYLVYYPAGVDVTATLNTLSGLTHLFVWHPGNLFLPDETSPTPGSSSQTIKFTTKTAGIYLFLVFGVKASVFDLAITPGGGPRLPLPVPFASAVTASAADLPLSPASAAAIQDGITFNPILPQSGLDPLAIAQDPLLFQAFVPVIKH
jgi:uncharacterized repeat protein (TIGR01451 family)